MLNGKTYKDPFSDHNLSGFQGMSHKIYLKIQIFFQMTLKSNTDGATENWNLERW